MNTNIFISYGHEEYDSLIYKLAEAIRNTKRNVFLDKDYLYLGSDWESIIDEHIKKSNMMLFFISKRSVNTNGYCLNELCRAGELKMPIIPIAMDGSFAPLSINRMQRISMMDCICPDGTINNDNFNRVLQLLLDLIDGKVSLGYAGEDIRLMAALSPINNDYELFTHYLNFCGRDKVFQTFNEWIKRENDEIFWICANPGVGKTAISAILCWRYPNVIGAVHFCKFNNSDRADAKRIIASIAFQLANRIPAYKEKLLTLTDLDSLYSKNATRLFEYLLIEQFINITSDSPIVIIIDALDEATVDGINELSKILLRDHKRLPSWIKLVITSRNENEIRRTLTPLSLTVSITDEINNKDLRAYYESELPMIGQDKLDILVNKSENSFLYAKEICKKIKENDLSLDNINVFPNGIYGFFIDSFDRIFQQTRGKDNSFEEVRPLFELLVVSQEPVTYSMIEDYLMWDEYKINRILSKISSFFPIIDDHIEILHKSIIEWLCNRTLSDDYYVSKKNAYISMLNYCNKKYINGKYEHNIYVLKHYGSILINLGEWKQLAEILNDYKLQQRRIEFLTLDSGLRLYLNELKSLYINDKEECIRLFSQKTFQKTFSTNRRLFYNSGLFFELREIGFSNYLRQHKDEEWDLEGEIGKLFYYYITEDFEMAIKKADSLLNNKEQMVNSDALLAEIYNVKGLSQRKLVQFDKALETFGRALECGENADYSFEISLAHLIMSKINCRMLNSEEAYQNSRKAIKVLKRWTEMLEGDEKIYNLLFLAEDYRVYADTLIWLKDLETAKDNLERCRDIYTAYKVQDRYYLRSEYTSVFYDIMSGNVSDTEDSLKRLERFNAIGKYDIGQIYFLYALYFYLYCRDDVNKLNAAISYAKKAYEIYDDIDSFLEREEAVYIHNKLQELVPSNRKVYQDLENGYIKTWIGYIDQYINEQLIKHT